MSEVYEAQENKLFCNNPRTDAGPVEVAECKTMNDLPPQVVASKLASRLNWASKIKDRAEQKDKLLDEVVQYLLSVDSKEIPGFLRHAVLKAYEV